eukprot:SM000011S19153  [mRNA]  locus=s11:1143753:1144682:- [translate_table: standard]
MASEGYTADTNQAMQDKAERAQNKIDNTVADTKAEMARHEQAARGNLHGGGADQNIKADHAKQSAAGLGEHAKETAGHTAGAVKEGTANAAGKTGAAIQGIGEKITHAAQNMKAKVTGHHDQMHDDKRTGTVDSSADERILS